MKIADIAKFLAVNIIRQTNYFSSFVGDLSSAVVSGSTVTVTTTKPHSLKAGEFISAPSSRLNNPITSVAQVGQEFKFETQFNHDLTLGYHTTVELTGFIDIGWNGTAILTRVPNRKTFYVSSSGKPGLPILMATELLREEIEIGGISYGLASVTPTGLMTFTYDFDIDLSGRTLFVPSIVKGVRVAAEINLERAVDSYTPQRQGQFWAFIVPQSTNLNKDRRTVTDAISERGRTTSLIETIIDNFDVYVFAPTSDEISAITSLDICRHDLLGPFLRSLRGVKFETGTAQKTQNGAVMISHGLEGYSSAYLIYKYSFQFTSYLNDDDQNKFSGTVAFRDIELITKLDSGVLFGTSKTINLDEEPL